MAQGSAKSYQQIVQQIAALELRAEEVRQKEVAGVIARMKEAISAYRLTPNDLFSKPAKSKKPAVKTKAKKAGNGHARTRRAKYKDDQGNTWIGLGKRPDWFKAALAAGKTPDELRV